MLHRPVVARLGDMEAHLSRIYRRFTPSENLIIRAALLVTPPMSIAELAAGFQRDRMTVHRRAVKLGLKGPDRITIEQERP